MSVALDTNIIIYAFDQSNRSRHDIARRILKRAVGARAIVPRQVLGELLNVAHRKRRMSVAEARRAAELLAAELTVADTTQETLLGASQWAERLQLQYFDALICTVAAAAGARWLVTEDMQDGLSVDGLTVIDPYRPDNAARVDELLGPT